MAKQASQTASAQSSELQAVGPGVGMVAENPGVESEFLSAAQGILANLDAAEESEAEERPRRRRPASEVIDDRLADEADAEDAADLEAEDEGEEEEPEREAGDFDDAEAGDEEGDEITVNGKRVSLQDLFDQVTHSVKINGEMRDVSYKDMVAGFQRHEDYTQKTQELSSMREEILPYHQMVAFAKHDPQFMSYVQSYFQNGPYPELANNQDLKITDAQLSAMFDRNSELYDPDRAQKVLQARAEWTQKSQERQRIMQATQQESQSHYREWANEQSRIATETINAMGEPPGEDGKGELDRKGAQIVATLREMGFNDDQIAGRAMINTADAKLAVLAYKASEYDRITKETEAPRVFLGKKRKRPAPPRSQAPGSGKRTASTRKRAQENTARATKTQRSEDWITAIAGRIKL